ncbi:MAG: YkvA family protein [Bacteroidales bacterium]|nr:DUF1232 domain-containing protein [Bacteroidales bacterium]MBS3776816.1 DUF1232 domain-containing protein [Bacteroidales bacterium]
MKVWRKAKSYTSNIWSQARGKIFSRIRRDLNMLRVGLTDPGLPWYTKAIIMFTVAYALSPIDLIPDFIPVLGLLDDLILVPVFISIAIKLIPKSKRESYRREAETRQFSKKKKSGGPGFFFWLLVLIGIILAIT